MSTRTTTYGPGRAAHGHCTEPARRQPATRTLGRIAAALGILLATLALAPEPEPVPRRWELQIEPSELRITSIHIPDVGPRSFIYLTYHVVNNSGQDVLFAPSFELSTGSGTTQRAGRDVPQIVTAELVKRTQNQFMQDQISIIGDILQGEEHARDGIAIWPLLELKPQELIVYAAGFSGESRTVTSPDGKEKFVLRKTLRIDYEAPGDLTGAAHRGLQVNARQWIMR